MSEYAILFLWIGASIVISLVPLVWIGRYALKGLGRREKRDFFLGFFGIIALNLCLYLVLFQGPTKTLAAIPAGLPWIVNLVPLLFFAIYRRWIAIGAVALLGFLLAWAVLAGGLFFVSCLLFAVGYAFVFGRY